MRQVLLQVLDAAENRHLSNDNTRANQQAIADHIVI